MQLSLCMIVKDEAFFIEECLDSAAAHVDEIVVVDTGSSDGTREIAGNYADRLLDFTWIDDFAAARNAGLAAVRGDWILVLDADERIAEEDYPRLREAMRAESVDGYYLQQRNYSNQHLQAGWREIQGEEPHARGWRGYTVNPIMRLFRRDPGIHYVGRIHEIVDSTVRPDARKTLDLCIHHYVEANPERSRQERSAGYLRLLERALGEPGNAGDGRLHALAGTTALYAVADYRKAFKYLIRAAELGYDGNRSLESAAEAAYRGGEIGQAQDIYHRLHSAGYRTPSLCLNMANLAVRRGDRQAGVALLEECLSLGGMDSQTDQTIRQNIDFLSGQS